MKEENLTTSIVLYGEINTLDSTDWSRFYFCSTNIINSIGVAPNYLGIKGESFKGGRIVSLNKVDKKLNNSFEKREEITSLEIYALPDDFAIAAFDYLAYISRTTLLDTPHILATFSNKYLSELDLDTVISKLTSFIKFESGQIFELNRVESPQIYASKSNSLSAFQSLRIIKELKE